MQIKTKRLLITDFTPDMAEAVHLGSLDDNTRRFLPDEVFETVEIAAETIAALIDCTTNGGPYVHPVFAADEYIGYVQLVPLSNSWEIGYHTVQTHTGHGYATEAVQAFLPVMMDRLGLTAVEGICHADNIASIRVLEKCGFRRVFEGEGAYQGQTAPIVKMVFTK